MDWTSYPNGFGSPNSDFWWGLEKMHRLTSSGWYQLQVQLIAAGRWSYQLYDDFSVGSNRSKYQLSLGNSRGDLGSSMRYGYEMKFTTHYGENNVLGNDSCGLLYASGWWLYICFQEPGANSEGLHTSGSTCGGHNNISCMFWSGLKASLSHSISHSTCLR